MAQTPEGKVKRDIRQWLEQQPDTFFFSPNAGAFGRSGIPDIVVCSKGMFVGIEVKAPGKLRNVTDLQQDIGDEIVEAGGRWAAVDSLTMLKDFWKEAVACARPTTRQGKA